MASDTILYEIICQCLCAINSHSGEPLNCGTHKCLRRCHLNKDHSKSLCTEVIYARCSNGHDVSHLCHKGPASFCSSCEKETKRAEKQKRDDIKRKAKEEHDKAEHELKMAEIEKKIWEERLKIRDVQLETDREQARLQKESDLRDAQEMAEKARRQKQNLASNAFNSSSVSPPVVQQNLVPSQPSQPPVSTGTFHHLSDVEKFLNDHVQPMPHPIRLDRPYLVISRPHSHSRLPTNLLVFLTSGS